MFTCYERPETLSATPRPKLTENWSDRREAVVAIVIYFQVALTSFSVLGLTEYLFTQTVTRHNMHTAAHIYKGRRATLADAVKPEHKAQTPATRKITIITEKQGTQVPRIAFICWCLSNIIIQWKPGFLCSVSVYSCMFWWYSHRQRTLSCQH